MSDVVTVAAFRKLFHNAGGMWRRMAVLTAGYHFVLFLMAECARQGLVLGPAGAEKVLGLLVTKAAVL